MVLARTEVNVLSDGERQCVNRLRCFRCFAIRVNPHLAEVVAEAWLKKCASGRIKGLARRAQHIGKIGWYSPLSLGPSNTRGEGGALQGLGADKGYLSVCLSVVLAAFFAFATSRGVMSAGT